MPSKKVGYRRVATLIVILVALVAAVSYGIAQTNVVTQAEWAVYMVQALELDWSLPPVPKSTHYISRLNWGSSIDFSALHLLESSSPFILVSDDVDPGFVQAEGSVAEALYRVNTLRPGDYAFRVKLAGGGGVIKIEDSVFEVFQPEQDFRWVDLSEVALDPGRHTVSLLLSDGTRAEAIGVIPPCLVSVEPVDGWQPLAPLTYGDLAVTVAKALDLEHGLPEIGPEMTLKGEDFTVTLEIPIEVESDAPDETPEPFWLYSGDSIVRAQIEFTVPEAGFYTLQAKYISPSSVRWVMNGCLRAITCPVVGGLGTRNSKIIATDLEAGKHTLEVTLPPNASLDRVVVQQRDPAIGEYMGIVSDEGVRLGASQEGVPRRRAVSTAIRLRGFFQRWAASLCKDSLLDLERKGAILSASDQGGSEAAGGSMGLSGPGGFPYPWSDDPILPTDVATSPPVASAVTPE